MLAAISTEREQEIEQDAHRWFADERGSRIKFVRREELHVVLEHICRTIRVYRILEITAPGHANIELTHSP
jgi:hypothetical protein